MAVPSKPFTVRDIATELGLSGTVTATDLAGATVNDCSPVTPDQSTPWLMDSWEGYDHAAVPAAPSNFQGNPGDDSSPQGDPQQDSHVFMEVDPLICAASYDWLHSATSGGSFAEVGVATGDEFFSYDIGAPETDGYFKARGNSNTGDDGALTAELHLRTCPTSPKSPGTSDDANCSNLTIMLSWGNGSSPGVRNSVVKWRVQKNGGGFGAWFSTSTGDSDVGYVAGSVVNDDEFDFELYYDEEGTATRVSPSTHIVLCPI